MLELNLLRIILLILMYLAGFVTYTYYNSTSHTQIATVSLSKIHNPNEDIAKAASGHETKAQEDKQLEADNNAPPPSYTFDDAWKEKTEELVANYINNNPQIIINSLQNWQQKEQAVMLAKSHELIIAKKTELEDTSFSPYVGNANSPLKIIVFYDYNCSYCKNANVVLDEVINRYSKNVTVIYKPFPVLGDFSKQLSETILAVYKVAPNKFRSIHEAFMELPNDATKEDIEAILIKNDIKISDIFKEIERDKQSTIKNIYNLAKEIGIRGAPAFIFDDNLYPGVVTLDEFSALIEKRLELNAETIQDKDQ
jgi:protein-disulfide isomerase